MTERRCPVCGASLEGRHTAARYCRPRCKIEASRVRRLLAGETVGPYESLDAYTRRRRNRRTNFSHGVEEEA